MKTEICSMRGFTSIFSSSSLFLVQPFLPPLTLRSSSPSSTNRYYVISGNPNLYVSSPKPRLPKNIRLYSLPSSDPNYEFDYDYEIDDDDAIPILSSSAESTTSDGVNIQINKLSRNSRRIVASVEIEAPIEEVWKVLTDYERLSDFIPGLALSRLLHKSPNFARLFQLGLGLKFNAKGILDCYEKPLETITYGSDSGCAGTVSLKRDIHFRMVEGDFDIFQGKWSIIQQQQQQLVQVDTREEEEGVERSRSRLRYLVDVKPKLWLPVGLVEGRLCNDIATNLASIRQQTHKNIST